MTKSIASRTRGRRTPFELDAYRRVSEIERGADPSTVDDLIAAALPGSGLASIICGECLHEEALRTRVQSHNPDLYREYLALAASRRRPSMARLRYEKSAQLADSNGPTVPPARIVPPNVTALSTISSAAPRTSTTESQAPPEPANRRVAPALQNLDPVSAERASWFREGFLAAVELVRSRQSEDTDSGERQAL